MLRNALIALVAIGAMSYGTVAQAQRGVGDRLNVLETKVVDAPNGRYSIDMTNSRGTVKALRIRADKGRMTLSNIRVKFHDGTVHNERRQIVLNEGERTRELQFPRSPEKFVDEIELVYNPVAGTSRTTIEVLGLQSVSGRNAKRPKAPATGDVSARPTTNTPTNAKPGEQVSGGSVLFGSARVGFGVDKDIIRVGSQVGKFQRIRMRVLENDIFVKQMKLLYANGESETLAVDAQVDANSVTRWFALKGDRFIQQIEFNYRSKPSFKGRARVEVFGEYADSWLGADGEARKFNDGWVLLGAETAGFVGFDSGVIPVAKNRGGLKKMRITVRDRAITLSDVRVVYANGKSDIIPVKVRVDAGSTWGPVDVSGGAPITEIRAKYRSRFIDRSARGKGAAVVEVWGRY